MKSEKSKFNYSKYESFFDSDTLMRFFLRFEYPFAAATLIVGLLMVLGAIIEYFMTNTIAIPSIKYIVGFFVVSYICRFHNSYTKNDRRLMLLLFYLCIRLALSIAFIVGSIILSQNNKVFWYYPFLIGICWFPTIEFNKNLRLRLKNAFIWRILIALGVSFFWYQSGYMF